MRHLIRPPVSFGANPFQRVTVVTATDNYSPGDMYDYMVWKGFDENTVAAIINDPAVNKRALANALTNGLSPADALAYGRQIAAQGVKAEVALKPTVVYTPPVQAAPSVTPAPDATATLPPTTAATLSPTDAIQPNVAPNTLLGIPYLYWALGAGAAYLVLGQ